MSKKTKRFEKISSETLGFQAIEVLRDKHTGTCYVNVRSGMSGGLTPLLDSHGQPVVT